MLNRTIFWIFIVMLMASCSRKISDPCENTNPQTTIDVNSDAIVCFESIDSYDLNYTNKKKININGELFLPKVKKEVYDAVIMTHGSGGKRRYHKKYVDLLTDSGLIVFQIDHYSARKIKYDKTFSKVSGITFMNDAYAALSLLKTKRLQLEKPPMSAPTSTLLWGTREMVHHKEKGILRAGK